MAPLNPEPEQTQMPGLLISVDKVSPIHKYREKRERRHRAEELTEVNHYIPARPGSWAVEPGDHTHKD